MIATEHFRKFGRKDFFLIFMGIVIVSIFGFLGMLFTPLVGYVMVVFSFYFVVGLLYYLLQKFGVAILMSLVSVVLMKTTELGVLGGQKVLTFFLAAVVFDLVYLIFKFRYDVVLSSMISALSLSLISSGLLSLKLLLEFSVGLVNLVLFTLLVAFVSSIWTLVFWSWLSRKKGMLKLRASMMRLR